MAMQEVILQGKERNVAGISDCDIEERIYGISDGLSRHLLMSRIARHRATIHELHVINALGGTQALSCQPMSRDSLYDIIQSRISKHCRAFQFSKAKEAFEWLYEK